MLNEIRWEYGMNILKRRETLLAVDWNVITSDKFVLQVEIKKLTEGESLKNHLASEEITTVYILLN